MTNSVIELIFIPAPGIGHIMSTVEIAKLLVNRDQRLSITVLVIMPPTANSAFTTYIDSLAKNTTMGHMISFMKLPQDEISQSNFDPKSPMSIFTEYIPSYCKHVRNAVADRACQPGRVAGFVIDMFCTCMIDVANEFNVPTYMFFTSGAAFLGFKFYIQTLSDDVNEDHVIELSNSDTELAVPSFANMFPTKLFWSIAQTRKGLDYVVKCVRKFREVKAIMVNTFLDLEPHAVHSLSADVTIPPVYPVGPILNLEGDSGGSGAGKWSDNEVIRWLDSQPPSSVVFLCFGSMGSFDEVQVKEIACGLERTGYRFVWSLRRPPSDQTSKDHPIDYEDPSMVLPEGFLERTREIGKVIGWAPQVAVLGHCAIGGFVSHCGWNSLLESLWFGVPLATWPMYAEQQMNAFEMVVELGLAVEIKLDYRIKDMFAPKGNTVIVTAEEIKSAVRRVMEDKEVRTKVKEMSKKSRSALMKDGSSYASIGYLIQDFMKNISLFE